MTDENDVELPRALALAWGVAAAPQRGPKREISVERIVEAAIAIADESGIASVSMAGVAARFDMTSMALYRYVSAKEDLVTLMNEYAQGMPPAIDPAAPWRDSVELWARAQLERFLSHPWILDLPIEGAPLTPNGLAWTEAGLAAMSGTGLDRGAQLSAILAVNGQMRWLAVLLRRDRGEATMEVDDMPVLRALVTADAYPHYFAVLFSGAEEPDPVGLAMAVVIEGIAAVASGRATVSLPLPSLPEVVRKDKRVREAGQRRRERERELQHAIREEQRALREAKRDLA